jgi:5-methylcytosine-specific restriction endonuclease McrA
MAGNAAVALDIVDGAMTPVKWDDWITLPVREQDQFVTTPRGQVRVPTVVVAGNYAKIPKKRPKFSARAIWDRDGRRCQYTGQSLGFKEGNIDHVVPRSRGGATNWENCVLAAKLVNTVKADRLPEEAGLRLLRKPSAPREVPVSLLIRNAHGIGDWEPFLLKTQK